MVLRRGRGRRCGARADGGKHPQRGTGGDAGLNAIAQLDDVAEILASVARFHAPNPAQDDCTLVGIEYKGQASSQA